MSLTEHDKHDLQLDPSIVPSPRFQFNHNFRLSQGYTILCVVRSFKAILFD